MTHMKRILVATDYSENSRRAETRAAMLSVELKAERLEIMAVQAARASLPASAGSTAHAALDDSAFQPIADGELVSMNLKLDYDGPHCVRTLRVGKAASAIAERAEEIRADLTVVALQKPRLLPDFLRGSGHHDVVRLSNRPTLIVKQEPESPYERVVVAVDFSDESEQAARVALAMAPYAHFTFVHACHVMHEGIMRQAGLSPESINTERMRLCEQSHARLNQFVALLGPRRQLLSRAVQYGNVMPVLREHARRMDADLIAVGKTGRSLLEQMLVGSVTKRLIGETSCDLVVAPLSYAPGWDGRPAA